MELLKDIQKNKEINFKKAQQLFDQGLYTNALGYFFKALNAVELMDDQALEISIKKGILFSYLRIGDYDLALEYCEDLLDHHDLDLEQRQLTLATKALAYNVKGRHSDSLSILESLSDSESEKVQYRVYLDQGLLYYRMSLFSEDDVLRLALENLKKAYEYRDIEGETSQFKSALNLGIVLVASQEYEHALECFQESLKYAYSDYFKVQVYNELARVYAYLDDMEKSEEFFEKAYRYALENDKFLNLAYNVYYRGLIQKYLGKMNNAYSYLHTALYSFLEYKHYPEVVAIYKELYVLFKESNPERAEYFLNEYYHFLNYIDPIGE